MNAGDLGALGRYARGLRSYLRDPLGADDARAEVAADLERRGENFLRVVDVAVYGNRASPYRRLLELAGIEAGDLVRLVADHGVEGALERLYDAGVHLTIDEFKGRKPIVRPGLELHVGPDALDNPLARRAMPGRTGGSRGSGRRVFVDLEHRRRQTVYHALTNETFGLAGRPMAVWRPVPPGVAGLGVVVAHVKLRARLERWFSQTPLTPRGGLLPEWAFTMAALAASRAARRPIPLPEHVPVRDAGRVAYWLAERCAEGRPAYLSTTASSAVRACLAALDAGRDIAGTFIRVGGEPYTAAKARAIERAGCRAVATYTLTEAGRVGIPCADPAELDDFHVLTDKLAVIRRERPVGPGGSAVGALVLTTLVQSCPKLMINVDTGDSGTLAERDCGCPLGRLGLALHLSGVRSYDKLTSEGMTFTGADLDGLVDELLPRRFGGGPTDYQLVEQELDGLPRVTVVVSPRVGPVDEDELVATVLDVLRASSRPARMMAAVWRGGDTLRVLRREPYETPTAKILPLHVLDGRAGAPVSS